MLQHVSECAGYHVQRRCFIDYSTFLEGVGTRKLDVRLRITNSVPEVIVKRGLFGAAVREEASIKFAIDQLSDGLNMMNLLGYSKGVAGGRRIHRAKDGAIEIALQEVLDYKDPQKVGAYFIEVEDLSGRTDENSSVAGLRSYLTRFGFTAFTLGKWNRFVEELNRRYNGVYEHGVTEADVIRRLGE